MKQAKSFAFASGVLDVIIGILILLGSVVLAAFGIAFVGAFSSVSSTDNVLADAMVGLTFGMFSSIGAVFLVIGIFCIAFSIIFIVFGTKCTKMHELTDAEFIKKRGRLLAYAIVETIFVILMIIALCTAFTIPTLMGTLVYAMIVIFKYVSYGIASKHKNSINQNPPIVQ